MQASQDADTESSLDFTCVAGIMNERGFALVFKRINVYLEEKVTYSCFEIGLIAYKCISEIHGAPKHS